MLIKVVRAPQVCMLSAPVTAIIAYDPRFCTEMPFLFPHEDRRPHFKDKPEHSEITAFRNSTLQGAYFMIAARALGLNVGALSGKVTEDYSRVDFDLVLTPAS